MSSGRIQLASVGIQDFYLTGTPDITYFQKVYKRHTSFALETLDNTFEDVAEFGGEVRCVIPRKGDLIRTIYLRVELPALTDNNSNIGYTDSVGNAIIEYADLIIGGQIIERITGEYMEIHNQYFVSDSKQESLLALVGTTGQQKGLGNASSTGGIYGPYPRTFLVPLPFYFYRHEPLSIPLTALTRQEVEVRIKFRKFNELYFADNGVTIPTNPKLGNTTLPVEYVFVGDEEASYLKKSRLDYLITQIQLSTNTTKQTNPSYRMGFVNPVKELFIAIQNSDLVSNNEIFNYSNPVSSNTNYHHLVSVNMDFNNETMIDERVADTNFMFSLQPLLHHTRMPKVSDKRQFYCYSFSINPEMYSPSGQINMSRIQNKTIRFNLSGNGGIDRYIKIYAKSYNILRIENGLAGLMFIDNNTV